MNRRWFCRSVAVASGVALLGDNRLEGEETEERRTFLADRIAEAVAMYERRRRTWVVSLDEATEGDRHDRYIQFIYNAINFRYLSHWHPAEHPSLPRGYDLVSHRPTVYATYWFDGTQPPDRHAAFVDCFYFALYGEMIDVKTRVVRVYEI